MPNIRDVCITFIHTLMYQIEDTAQGKHYFMHYTRELPGVALVNISTGQIFMGKGNILNYIDILK